NSQSLLKIHLNIVGRTHEPYHLVEEDAFQLVGFSAQVPVIHLGEDDAIALLERSLDHHQGNARKELSNVEPGGAQRATEHHDDRTQALYWHAVTATATPPEDTEVRHVPAGQWVVFSTEGKVPEAFQQLWATAATEWFPANPYEWAPGPQLLAAKLNATGDQGTAELWIPITPK